jgi:hypothetical protein
MNALYTILLLVGGISLIVWGIWLTIKEIKSFSKWPGDGLQFTYNGAGLFCIGAGVILIAFAVH